MTDEQIKEILKSKGLYVGWEYGIVLIYECDGNVVASGRTLAKAFHEWDEYGKYTENL